MRLSAVVVVVVAAACVGAVLGRVFTKCELAEELERIHKMSREEVKIWVCIAQYESTFNSSAINHFNWDGSKDFGLFQLNNKYWCDNSVGRNECRMRCSDLLDDDLTDDIKCIKKILRDTERWKGKGTGLTAWVAYVSKCQNRNLDTYMKECWANADLNNNIEVKQEPAQVTPSPTVVKHEPIINNARVPVKPVIANMYHIYPLLPPPYTILSSFSVRPF